ncbi:MAG: tetratricopeptide repeat protein [Verrucomicrobiaceae bacterium]|nr:tetratricopeptide repeat protein [Verrucomicrobiaceae bacterium]
MDSSDDHYSAMDELHALGAGGFSDEANGWKLIEMAEGLLSAVADVDSLAAAEAYMAAAIEDGATPELLARLWVMLSILQECQGKDASGAYEAAIEALESLPEPDVLGAARLRNNLAMIKKQQGELSSAESLYLKAAEVLEQALGKDNEEVAALYNNMGGLYYAAGFTDQARETFLEALEMRKKVLGEDHPDVAQSLANLGSAHYELGQEGEALACYRRSLDILEKHLEQKRSSYEAVGEDLVALLMAVGDEDEADAVRTRLASALA